MQHMHPPDDLMKRWSNSMSGRNEMDALNALESQYGLNQPLGQQAWDRMGIDEAGSNPMAGRNRLGTTGSDVILHPRYSSQALKHAEADHGDEPPTRRPYVDTLTSQKPASSRYQPSKRVRHDLAGSQPGDEDNEKPVPVMLVSPADYRSIFDAPKVADPDGAAERIAQEAQPLSAADFYELMGMHPPVVKNENPRSLETKHGLYGTILWHLKFTQRKYHVFDILTYFLLIAQLCISAVFIVLGSLTSLDSHIAIAVLGAFSVVFGGGLALMKGQGLPNRLRQTRDALKDVKFEADELYWDVGADKAVFYKDVKKLREDFLRVMEEANKNHPDTWNKISEGIARGATPAQRATTGSVQQSAIPHLG